MHSTPRVHILALKHMQNGLLLGKKKKIENKLRRKRTNLIEQIISNNYIYIEASNYSANLIEELHRLFNGKFIHLYCNGRDFVSRGIDKDWYKVQPLKYRVQAWIRRKFIADIGRTKFDHQLKPPKELKTRIEKIAWLWVEINRIILRHLSNIPDEEKFSIRLEDLGRDRLVDLHKFLGIEVIPEVLDNMTAFLANIIRESKSSFTYPYPVWSDDEKMKFLSIAGEMMQILGYSEECLKDAKVV